MDDTVLGEQRHIAPKDLELVMRYHRRRGVMKPVRPAHSGLERVPPLGARQGERCSGEIHHGSNRKFFAPLADLLCSDAQQALKRNQAVYDPYEDASLASKIGHALPPLEWPTPSWTRCYAIETVRRLNR